MSYLTAIFLYTPIGVGLIILAVKIYFKMVAGVCKSKRRIDGQVAIITGANSGKAV